MSIRRHIAPPHDPATVAGAGEPVRAHTRAGFTMVEVIIAIVILAVGVLGMAGTTAFVVRQITLADLMTERAAAFQTTIEKVQALDYDDVSFGTDSVGIFAVKWTSSNVTAQVKDVTIITAGPGLDGSGGFYGIGPQVLDTFSFYVLRGR